MCPNFSPYAFIENDRIVGPAPTMQFSNVGGRLSQNPGPAQAGFDRKQVAPTLAKKTCEWIDASAKTGKPFFLYLALTGPHSPIIPNDEFKGKSGIGDYGDWVMEMDWTVGEVMRALKTRRGRRQHARRSSPPTTARRIWNYEEAPRIRALRDGRVARRQTRHLGRRSPGAVRRRWPGRVPAGTTNAEVICHAI